MVNIKSCVYDKRCVIDKGASVFSNMQGCPLDGNNREYIPLIKKE